MLSLIDKNKQYKKWEIVKKVKKVNNNKQEEPVILMLLN